MWGQSRADVRQWLEGHPIAPADLEAMLDVCFAERARVMREKGRCDLLVSAILMLVGVVGLVVWPGVGWVFASQGVLLVMPACACFAALRVSLWVRRQPGP
jgi:hypothetical protein